MDNNLIYVVCSLLGLCLLLTVINNIRLNGMIKKYRSLIRGLGNGNVEELMVSYSKELYSVKEQINNDIDARLSILEDKMDNCIKNVGIVSYDAFKNISNNMSFSIAALNDKKDGLVFTGIYTRENSYVYAKEIKNGKGLKKLSDEEQEALEKALLQIK